MADHIQIPIHDQPPPTEAIKDEIEEVKKVDHSSVEKKKETNGQDLSGPQNGRRLRSHTIFKVNEGLRKSNRAAYMPEGFSIGLYHNKSPNVLAMQKYKQSYQQRFLNRKEGIDEASCIRELEKLKNKALMCYDDIENVDKDIVDKFLEIMLLDGCFLVEFIRERFGILPRGGERDQEIIIDQEWLIIKNTWMIHQVLRDMVVLENQLPFFVLTMLYDMTKSPDEESFLHMVSNTLLRVCPMMTDIPNSEIDSLNAEQFHHLLHVVHKLSCPSDTSNSMFHDMMVFLGRFFQRSREIHIESVTKLQEKGIGFKKIESVEGDDRTTLLDIRFEKGFLEIPCFRVDDSTETVLRNLIAYEQHSSNVYPYFSSYAQIMSQLINSDKDVQLLRESEIIDGQRDDNNVAKIFYKLSDGVKIDPHKFYYKEECSRLIQYCQKPRNKMMAYLRKMMISLRDNYFFTPWAGAATVGGIMLLILTAIQTVLAFRKCK